MGKLLNFKTAEREFSIKNKKDVAEVIIYSEIGENFWGDGMSAKAFDEALKELPSNVKQINVRLNSVGGDVFDGMTIYNRLKQHPANVTVYVDGLAASIASVIMLAGDEVIFGEGALMMIHSPFTIAMGNATELERTIQLLDEIEEQIIGIYKRKTKKERSELKNLMAKETWFNSQEALEFGFADRVMEETEVVDIAATLDNANWLRNRPKVEAPKKYINKKLNDLKKDIEGFLAR